MTGPESGHDQPGLWRSDEQIGDIYEAEIGADGQVERAERLTDTPRIWVGSWLDYNNGVLYGEWIDAAQDDEALQADIAAMLAASPTTAETGEPAEDWGIFDHDNFGPLRIGEQESLSWVGAVARGIAEHGLAFAAYADVMEDEAALPGFEDSYIGQYDSLEAYAEELVEHAGYDRLLDEHLPAGIRAYVRVDTAQLAHDLFLSGDVHVLHGNGGVWLFHAQ